MQNLFWDLFGEIVAEMVRRSDVTSLRRDHALRYEWLTSLGAFHVLLFLEIFSFIRFRYPCFNKISLFSVGKNK